MSQPCLWLWHGLPVLNWCHNHAYGCDMASPCQLMSQLWLWLWHGLKRLHIGSNCNFLKIAKHPWLWDFSLNLLWFFTLYKSPLIDSAVQTFFTAIDMVVTLFFIIWLTWSPSFLPLNYSHSWALRHFFFIIFSYEFFSFICLALVTLYC